MRADSGQGRAAESLPDAHAGFDWRRQSGIKVEFEIPGLQIFANLFLAESVVFKGLRDENLENSIFWRASASEELVLLVFVPSTIIPRLLFSGKDKATVMSVAHDMSGLGSARSVRQF
jgi:hypothetical protein